MNSQVPLPSEYVAFEYLNFCSNVLINGGVPVRAKGYLPVLVGRGLQVPEIWLSATKDGMQWEQVVERNTPVHKNFTVNLLSDGQSVQVVLGNVIIIQAKEISDIEGEVSILDLRPLGVRIHGNQTGLQVGGKMLIENTFQGVAGMIDIG